MSQRDDLLRIRAGFRRISESCNGQLQADWHLRVFKNGKSITSWRIHDAEGQYDRHFTALAIEAVELLELPYDGDPVDAWLVTLRGRMSSCLAPTFALPVSLFKDGEKAGEEHSATIHDVAGASADLVDLLMPGEANEA
jgi:hypothetical protein